MVKLKRKYPLFVSIAFLGVMFSCYFLGMEINVTPSMARGLYVRAYGPIHRGDIISFCLKNPYKTLGLRNLYLEQGRRCGGSAPLIKQVIAMPGDDIILSNQYIEINEVKYFYKTQRIDSIGRKLDAYPRGYYPHIDGYWVIGTNALNSWDSRYWGAINKNQILYKLKPLLTWK
jgi:conjugative transfer signal peptidase TraF